MIDSRNLPIILEYLFPDLVNPDDYMVEYDKKNDLHKIIAWNNNETQPDDATINAAEPAAMAALRIDQLKLYAEESGLRRGCDILDPLTGEPSGDSSAPIHVIRQQTGQARNHLVYLKLDGTEAQKVSASNCQAVEENLSLVVAQTIVAVQSGTITTEAEIDAAINAIDLAY